MNLMGAVVGFGLLLLAGLFSYSLGGWGLVFGMFALFVVAGVVIDARKLKPDTTSEKNKRPADPTTQLPDKKPAYVPTPEQLAQIEQARQSSLASLKAKERVKKYAYKAAITPPYIPPSTQPVAAKPKPVAKPTAQDIEPIDLPDRVEIQYLKSDGCLDRRIVKVNQVDRFGGKFTGFCERAGAVRTFKLSGIQGRVTRLETGELVDYRAWFNALKGKSTPSPKPAQRERKSAVALLGFHYSKYEALAEQVEAAGWHARHALSDSVDYVVFGPNAGDQQRKDADKRAITELSESQLKKML